VICASTGNHGFGVAQAARVAGVRATVYLPAAVAHERREAIAALGAGIELVDGDCLAAELAARSVAAERGSTFVSPYNDLRVVAGQGTLGIELLEQVPDLDAVFIAVGGGGLISGVAGYVKSVRPEIAVVGCWPRHAPAMYECIRAGRIVEVREARTPHWVQADHERSNHMRTLIYGAGPIGQWLALKLAQADADVTLLARGAKLRALEQRGIILKDALTGERLEARPRLVARLDPEDRYDLVVVAMSRASRLAVCPDLARNPHLRHILFLGNDVDGFHRYGDYLPPGKVLLGFPGAGGGFEDGELTILDREKKSGEGELYIGEIDGQTRERTTEIAALFTAAGLKVHVEQNIDGWLKYHFAFIGPTVGAVYKHGGEMKAVAADSETIHQYCRACRQAGDVLRAVGYRKRQPGVFNLYYWMPRWLEPKVFAKLFGSEASATRFGLHARTIGPELLEMAEDFEAIKRKAGLETPDLDALLACVPRATPSTDQQEVS
jgi:ketopantoate reductase